MQTARNITFFFAPSLVAFPAVAHAMPEGAFLKHPVYSVSGLRHELRDASTLALYQKAFGATKADLQQQFGKLHLTSLRHDAVMRVYYRSKDAHWGYRTRRVRRGTRIFADRNGTAVLIRVCGNPVKTRVADEEVTNATIPDFSPDEPMASVIPSSPLQLGENRMSAPSLTDADLLTRPEVAEAVPSDLERGTANLIPSTPGSPEPSVNLASPGVMGGNPGFSLTRLGRLPLWIATFGLPALLASRGNGSGLPGGLPFVGIGSGNAPLFPAPGTSIPVIPITPTTPALPITPPSPGTVPAGGTVIVPTATPEPGTLSLILALTLSAGYLLRKRN